MQTPPLPDNETQRLQALLECNLLDTPAEERFDRITRLARQLFQTRIALISLLDRDRQWFKSRQGLSAEQTGRDISFCGHTILQPEVFIVEDALADPRFVDNPLVTGEPNIRFYAGAPISTSDGYCIGTLCIIDDQPRSLDEAEVSSLRDLADCVQDEMLLRRQLDRQDALLTLARITSLQDVDTRELLRQALAIACDYLGLPIGIISHIEDEDYHVQIQSSPPDTLTDGQIFPLGDTYCSITLQANDVVAIDDMGRSAYAGHPCYRTFQLESYIGIPLYLDEQRYGTLNFSSPESRALNGFSEGDLEFMRLLGGWVSNRLQRWHLNQSLLRSEARLRGLFELSPVGIALNDFETGAFIEVNDALLKPTGYSRDEFMQLSYWDITPRDYEPQETEQLEQLKTTGRYGPYEKEYLRKDGSRYPVLLQGIRLDDPSGRRLIWSIVEDITERKRAERLKNEFVSTVSHELRTPLTSIAGVLGLLEQGVVGELPQQARELVAIACKNSERLSALINDLLDMEKLAAGKMHFDLRPHRLGSLLKQSIEANREYAARHEVSLQLQATLPDVQLFVDDNRFQQIMANLLSNAAKFSPAGSQVSITGQRVNGGIQISVTDQGPGIPTEFQPRVFQKFAQEDASNTRQKGGTGLGLAITRELVERMHGRIGFATSSEGTTFSVTFPVRNGVAE